MPGIVGTCLACGASRGCSCSQVEACTKGATEAELKMMAHVIDMLETQIGELADRVAVLEKRLNSAGV